MLIAGHACCFSHSIANRDQLLRALACPCLLKACSALSSFTTTAYQNCGETSSMRLAALLPRATCLLSSSYIQLIRHIVPCTRTYCSAGGPWLYRDFIQQSLYHPTQGYFNKPQPPVKRLAEPINFNRILNQAEYKMVLSRVYKDLQVDWLTPVEVFAPWYGRAIARFILETRKHTLHSQNQPLAIVEIGGGTGTLAASILDYIAGKEPVTYSAMSYTTIEISSSLAAMQHDLLVQQRGHSQTWRCVAGDASQVSSWGNVAASLPLQHNLQQHCFVLMMEVLDNLPHDRVMRQTANGPWQQAAIVAEAQQQQQQQQHIAHGVCNLQPANIQQSYSEILKPADDPLIQRCLNALHLQQPANDDGSGSSNDGSSNDGSSSISSRGLKVWLQQLLGLPDSSGSDSNVWLPTHCLQLLEVLHAVLPSHTVIASDFDALPDITISGRTAPLVSGREGPSKQAVDYETVLLPWGSVDIFFPTDFDSLAQLYNAAAVTGPALHGPDTAAVWAKRRNQRVLGKQQQQQNKSAQQEQQEEVGQQAQLVHCSHTSTAEFMAGIAEAKHTRLLSGYNPLIQDWLNTRVFIGQAK